MTKLLKMRIISLLALLILTSVASAQNIFSLGQNQLTFYPFQDDDDEWEEDEDTGRGFGIGINLGVYFANKNSAVFYNGTCAFDINDNIASCRTIEDRLRINMNVYNDVIELLDLSGYDFYMAYDDYPVNMRYDPSILFGIHMAYNLNYETSIFLDLNSTNLKTHGRWTLETTAPAPAGTLRDLREFDITGEENRINIRVGYRGGWVINEGSNFYLEAGPSMLGVKFKENYITLWNDQGMSQDYNLMVGYNGLGSQITNYNAAQTGVGYGFFIGAGLQFIMAEQFEFVIGGNAARENVKLGTFDQNVWNYSAFVSFGI